VKKIKQIAILAFVLPLFVVFTTGCGGETDEQIEEQEDRISQLEAQFEEELARLRAQYAAKDQSCGVGQPDANGNICPEPATAQAETTPANAASGTGTAPQTAPGPAPASANDPQPTPDPSPASGD